MTRARTVALIAGLGRLPQVIVDALDRAGEAVVIAALQGFEPDLPGHAVDAFRLERLVPFLDRLADRGVTHICLAGAVRRHARRIEFEGPHVRRDGVDAHEGGLLPGRGRQRVGRRAHGSSE